MPDGHDQHVFSVLSLSLSLASLLRVPSGYVASQLIELINLPSHMCSVEGVCSVCARSIFRLVDGSIFAS